MEQGYESKQSRGVSPTREAEELNALPPLALSAALTDRLPGASLRVSAPPYIPQIRLWLLNDLFEHRALAPEVINALMEEPPYWTFCWASGQVLAQHLLMHPESVRGRCVVDVGPGSGVVAIAAALAGAERVIACDLDANALLAVSANAELNGVQIEQSMDLGKCLADASVVTAADILYDRDNLELLESFRAAQQVLLADSRIRDLAAPGYSLFHRQASTTWPDLAESQEFNEVRLYEACSEPWPHKSV